MGFLHFRSLLLLELITLIYFVNILRVISLKSTAQDTSVNKNSSSEKINSNNSENINNNSSLSNDENETDLIGLRPFPKQVFSPSIPTNRLLKSESSNKNNSLKSNDDGNNNSQDDTNQKTKLVRHSFESPLTKDSSPLGQLDWIFDGAAVTTKQYVVLTPSIQQVTGQFFHKNPIYTNHFQAEFTFTFHMALNQNNTQPDGFMFLFTSSPYTSSQEDLPSVLGYPTNFDGLAVIFSFKDKFNKLRPKISAFVSSSKLKLNSPLDVSSFQGKFFDMFNINNQPLTFNLIVSPISILGSIKTPKSNWEKVFDVKGQSIIDKGYIGFSSSSGNKINNLQPSMIALKSLDIYNLDPTKKGEYDYDEEPSSNLETISNLLNEDRQYNNEADLFFGMKEMSKMLFQQISDQTSRESEILRITRNILLKFNNIESSLTDITSHLNVLLENNNQSTSFSSLTNELSGFKKLLYQQSKNHNSSLDIFSTKLRDKLMQEDKTRSEFRDLLNKSKSTHSLSFFLIVFLMLMIFSFGLFLWKRFRDMEKKHFL